jgi:hypothetical protein
MLDRLCIDIKLIVYRLVHRHSLSECLSEIQTKLLWNDDTMWFQQFDSVGYMLPRANYRTSELVQCDKSIYDIWTEHVSRKVVGAPRLPPNW